MIEPDKRSRCEVASVTVEPPSVWISACQLVVPTAGDSMESGAVTISGWLQPRTKMAVAVEITFDSALLRRVRVAPANNGEPGIPAAISRLRRQRFQARLDLRAVRAPLRIDIHAVLERQQRARLGWLHVRPQARHPGARNHASVSIIIPCYRQAPFLAEAIESALAQSGHDIEVIVVVDGSPDNAAVVAARYPGVNCVVQQNHGLAAARNTGMHASRGEYLIFLDADDRLLPHAADLGIAQLESLTDAAFASGFYRYIDADGAPLPSPSIGPVKGDAYGALLCSNFTGTPATTIYRRRTLLRARGFDTTLQSAEDYELNLRLARRYPIVAHGHVVAEYRQHQQMMSGNNDVMLASVLRVLGMQPIWTRARYMRQHVHGRRVWRDYYGLPLSRDMWRRIEGRHWREAARGALCLLRHHPRLLLEMFLQRGVRSA